MFHRVPRMEQAREFTRWVRELAKVTRVAICSGNHDDTGRQILADRAPVYEWLLALGREPQMITDGATDTIGDLVVTTVPYHCSKEQKMVWLDRGLSLRLQRGSKWIVLHHVPPRTYPDALGEVVEAADLLPVDLNDPYQIVLRVDSTFANAPRLTRCSKLYDLGTARSKAAPAQHLHLANLLLIRTQFLRTTLRMGKF